MEDAGKLGLHGNQSPRSSRPLLPSGAIGARGFGILDSSRTSALLSGALKGAGSFPEGHMTSLPVAVSALKQAFA